jgi:hypothetical protein
VSWTRGYQPSRPIVLGLGLKALVLIQMDSKSHDVIQIASTEDMEYTPRHLLLPPYASLYTDHVTLDALPGVYISRGV